MITKLTSADRSLIKHWVDACSDGDAPSTVAQTVLQRLNYQPGMLSHAVLRCVYRIAIKRHKENRALASYFNLQHDKG